MLRITTSWDDGDTLDSRLSDLLCRYGATGTFYITKKYRPNRLSEDDIRSIASAHEVGAHSITHPDLRALSPQEQKKEVRGSKDWLQQLVGKEIRMFCYPKGFFNETVTKTVKEAGFLGARTTALGAIGMSADSFHIDTTIQVYPFPFRKLDNRHYYWWKLFEPYKQRATALHTLGVPTIKMYSWLSTAEAVFDYSRANGETFHLWGHSWEIDKYGMWDELEKLLHYMSRHDDCVYVTNSKLLK